MFNKFDILDFLSNLFLNSVRLCLQLEKYEGKKVEEKWRERKFEGK